MSRYLNVNVIRGHVLGVEVLRGFAKLCDLARMSRADIYDQKRNPTGTQRDLSPKHAKDAYEYVRTRKFAFWPEVFLCARDKRAVQYQPGERNPDVGTLRVDMQIATQNDTIAISRVDGNHRLHYASGAFDELPPLDKEVSFCMAVGLTPEGEITLFRDINDNQRRMNTSHLDNIELRLTPEDRVKRNEPALYIAQHLSRDSDSPLYDRVFEGGKKVSRTSIPLRTLRTGIEYMLSRPSKLTALRDADAQLKVIKHYFEAVRDWMPDAWENPSDYLVLRGAGLWSICFIGSDVIDRTLAKGRFASDDMMSVLKSGKTWDWSNKGDFQGLGGRGGAVKISEMVTAEFQDESAVSVKDLFKKIMET